MPGTIILGALCASPGPVLGGHWGHLWAVLDVSWGALGAVLGSFGAALGHPVSCLGLTGPLLELFWECLWLSWGSLGALLGSLEPKRMKNQLSWSSRGALLGCLGALLGSPGALLGCLSEPKTMKNIWFFMVFRQEREFPKPKSVSSQSPRA